MSKIYIQDLKDFCKEVLVKEGMDDADAAMTAEVLAETDAFGTNSHGTKNLGGYIDKAHVGGVSLTAKPEVVREGAAYALIDAHDCIGMVAGSTAMNLACEKAEQAGIAIVTVKNSCHFGAAGYYANMAARKGLIGVSMSNVDPNMTVPCAKGMVIGNNPFAYAAPSESVPTVFLDVAMSNVASLKVVQARKDGKEIPSTWIVDKDGLPTTDPSHYPEEGAMQPFAAHKGYGFAVFVELLSGILSGGCTSMSGDIVSWCFEPEKKNSVCHTFIAINPALFGEERVEKRVETMARQLREAPKAKNATRIFTPGEIEWERYLKAEKEGIDLPAAVEESLVKLSQSSGVALKLM